MVWASAAGAVYAHDGGQFGVEIPAERIPPGAELPLVGAEWAPDVTLEVNVQSGDAPARSIARIQTDEHGHFATLIDLPDDLPEGTIAVQVRSDYGVLDTAVVTLDASAPPYVPAPGDILALPPAAPPEGLDPFPVIALAAALLALLVLFLRTRARSAQNSVRKGA
jgi:hypothetical protein